MKEREPKETAGRRVILTQMIGEAAAREQPTKPLRDAVTPIINNIGRDEDAYHTIWKEVEQEWRNWRCVFTRPVLVTCDRRYRCFLKYVCNGTKSYHRSRAVFVSQKSEYWLRHHHFHPERAGYLRNSTKT